MSSTNQPNRISSNASDASKSDKRRTFSSTRDTPTTPNAVSRSSAAAQQQSAPVNLFQTPPRPANSNVIVLSPDTPEVIVISDSPVQPITKKQRPVGTTPNASRFQVLASAPAAALSSHQDPIDIEDDDEEQEQEDDDEVVEVDPFSLGIVVQRPVSLPSPPAAAAEAREQDSEVLFKEIEGLISKMKSNEIRPQQMMAKINIAAKKHRVAAELVQQEQDSLVKTVPFAKEVEALFSKLKNREITLQQMLARLNKAATMQQINWQNIAAVLEQQEQIRSLFINSFLAQFQASGVRVAPEEAYAIATAAFEDFKRKRDDETPYDPAADQPDGHGNRVNRLLRPTDYLPRAEDLQNILQRYNDKSLGKDRFYHELPQFVKREHSTRNVFELVCFFVLSAVSNIIVNHLYSQYLATEEGKHAPLQQREDKFTALRNEVRLALCGDNGKSSHIFLAAHNVRLQECMMNLCPGFIGPASVCKDGYRAQFGHHRDSLVTFEMWSQFEYSLFFFLSMIITAPFPTLFKDGVFTQQKQFDEFVVAVVVRALFKLELANVRSVTADGLLEVTKSAFENYCVRRDEPGHIAWEMTIQPLDADAPVHATMIKLFRIMLDGCKGMWDKEKQKQAQKIAAQREHARREDEFLKTSRKSKRTASKLQQSSTEGEDSDDEEGQIDK